jgi:hypothetical protein
MNELSSDGRTLVRIEVHSDKVSIIDAVCINCNKRFKSMRAVSMHLKMTGTRHAVIFISYGNYDKNTGLRTPLVLMARLHANTVLSAYLF